QRFEERGLRAADHLHPFAGKIFGEPGQRQAGPVDRRLANDPLQTPGSRHELHLQFTGVFGVKTFNRDDVALHKWKWSDGVLEPWSKAADEQRNGAVHHSTPPSLQYPGS